MASHSKRVLLTGADGFTGRYLAIVLAEAGWEVYGLSNTARASEREIVADLLDRDSLVGSMKKLCPDAVIHLAGISFVEHADPLDFYRVNLFGTMNLMHAIQDAGLSPQKVIIASSANVYGHLNSEHADERICPMPANHYGMSKLAMERMVCSHFEKQNVLITRPFNYTGVGQDRQFLVPKIVDHFRRGVGHIELGNLDVARDFLDVRDVAAAYLRLLESDMDSGLVNICSGEAVTLSQILSMAEEIAGRSMEIRVNPKFVREGEIKRFAGDNTLLKEVGWKKTYAFNETLRWMLTAG